MDVVAPLDGSVTFRAQLTDGRCRCASKRSLSVLSGLPKCMGTVEFPRVLRGF